MVFNFYHKRGEKITKGYRVSKAATAWIRGRITWARRWSKRMNTLYLIENLGPAASWINLWQVYRERTSHFKNNISF